ncbi:hypothetical protein ACFHYQ_07940 [Sphaerimonospora cavernae]|uniref:Uncharacterized protein n=1 Tax=Sphaerimonospora cavernae TaxID=1740611 RepID=A0ABV6U2Z2_9ACTN
MNPTGPIAHRFPLVARPRPACTPLDNRVDALCALARTAEQDNDPASASAVFNQAALLASDIGLPDLARAWCHRHAGVYLQACPLGGRARYALEPLVNLARLHIRDGNGDAALDLLATLYDAVTSQADTTVDGLPVPASTLTTTPGEHQELRQWLWTVHLADGARALTRAGRWRDALTHMERHNGIGRRMLDGRQVAVIAAATAGDTGGALTLLADTAPGEAWENAVTACLRVLCGQAADRPIDQDLAVMLDLYRQFTPGSGLAVFETRLGLSVVDAAGVVDDLAAQAVAVTLVQRTVGSGDGYAAREVLGHDGCSGMLADGQARVLAELVEACALDRRKLPTGSENELSAALDISEGIIRRAAETR